MHFGRFGRKSLEQIELTMFEAYLSNPGMDDSNMFVPGLAQDGPTFRGCYGIGTLAASIERRNLTTLARSAALDNVSTPPVLALRRVTLFSTSSSEVAAPLWKKA